jgi:hypothetical protein
MTELVMLYSLVEANGKTIKENNLERQHSVPMGALVEVKFDEWFGGGACWQVHARLWVVSQDRDCDGTPLYTLSRWRDAEFAMRVKDYHTGFAESSLQVVELTLRLAEGYDSLSWDAEAE